MYTHTKEHHLNTVIKARAPRAPPSTTAREFFIASIAAIKNVLSLATVGREEGIVGRQSVVAQRGKASRIWVVAIDFRRWIASTPRSTVIGEEARSTCKHRILKDGPLPSSCCQGHSQGRISKGNRESDTYPISETRIIVREEKNASTSLPENPMKFTPPPDALPSPSNSVETLPGTPPLTAATIVPAKSNTADDGIKTDVTDSGGAGCLRAFAALCAVPRFVEAGDLERLRPCRSGVGDRSRAFLRVAATIRMLPLTRAVLSRHHGHGFD